MAIVVKRRGHVEGFDEKKVYGSIYAACASAHLEEKSCEKLAEKITKQVKAFATKKRELQAKEIHLYVEKELKKVDKELAFYYDQHVPNLKKL